MKTFFALSLLSLSAWAQVPPPATEVLKALLPATDYLGRAVDNEDCTVFFFRSPKETRVLIESTSNTSFILKADARYTWTSNPPVFISTALVSDDGAERVETGVELKTRAGGKWTVSILRIFSRGGRTWKSSEDCFLD